MNDFKKHFKMNENDAIRYVKEVMKFFGEDEEITCHEIGDGNINYIFRIENPVTKKSVILKHADTTSRTNSSTELDAVHNIIEAEILKLQNKLAPGLVPEVYHFDPIMCCIAMEDCRDYENMRHALCRHEMFPGFAEQITDFMVPTLIGTCDSVLPPGEKRNLAKDYTNVALDHVTERLVYTEPYTNTEKKNIEFDLNRDFFQKELYSDESLRLEAAKLLYSFKTENQSLIHGDLHSGSIMVKKGSIKVLDPEFATFAPAGYDVGNLIANLLFALVNAKVTMEDSEQKTEYVAWLEKTIVDCVDLFHKKAIIYLRENTTDVLCQTAGYNEWLINRILEDTAGIAGLEMNRRVIGVAKVKDIAGIENPMERKIAERTCVYMAKFLIMNRQTAFRCGNDYIDQLNEAYRKAVKQND